MSRIAMLAAAAIIAAGSPAFAALIDNGVKANALVENALVGNALAENAIEPNAVNPNAIRIHGLTFGGADGMKVIGIELAR